MNPTKLVAVFAENHTGRLARCAGILAESGVNIHWLGIAGVNGFGVIRFLVDKTDLAYRVLKSRGFTCSLPEILAVEMADEPGSLHFLTSKLAEAKVNLKNCSGFVFNGRAIILIETDQLEAARRVVREQDLHELSEEELLSL